MILLGMIQERREELFSRVNNQLTVQNKATQWKTLCSEFKDATGIEDLSADKLIKKWDNLKTKLRVYTSKVRKSRSKTGGGPAMPSDPVMELCWDILGRDNPSLVTIKGATTSAPACDDDTFENNVTEDSSYNSQIFTSAEPSENKIFTSAMVAKLACQKLEEEIVQNREEHKLRMQVLMAKREFYTEKTSKLVSHFRA